MIVPAAAEAGRIGEAFFFVRDLFLPPDTAQWERLSAPETTAAWASMAEHFDIPEDLGLPATAADYETSFISAFDAGTPHPPIPLIESHYNRREPLPRILHENILYYQTFGVRLRDASNETSDHLRHQLEFVGHLYRMEADELLGPSATEILAQIRAGRRDFLERHLLSWLPQAAEMASKAPERWIANYVASALKLVTFAMEESATRPSL